MEFRKVLARPVAILPLLVSLVAFLVVVGHVAMLGNAHEVDEGSDAHVFQLLMATQVPLIAYFAYRWLPKAPRAAFAVLTLQEIAVVAALAPVAYYNL